MLAHLLRTWLNRTGEFRVVGYACTVEQGWDLCTTQRPDVALLDIGLAGGDGLLLAQRLKHTSPHIKIIVVSGREDPYTLYRIQRLDLPGYVSKGISVETIREAILAVAQGRAYYTAPFERHLQAPDAFFRVLTAREVEALFAATQWRPQKVACKKLRITVGTLQKHLSNIRRKLDLHTPDALLRYAMHLGMGL